MVGLKENVIIGKLIPAGAGLSAYRDMAEAVVPEMESLEEAPLELPEPEEEEPESGGYDSAEPMEESEILVPESAE